MFINENVCTPVCMLSPGLSVLMVRDALFVSLIGPANILLSMGTFVSKKQIAKRKLRGWSVVILSMMCLVCIYGRMDGRGRGKRWVEIVDFKTHG